MAPKKGLAGKDAFARMNYLYQASALCSSFSGQGYKNLAAYYGSIFRNVGTKALLRAEPEIKRTLCKGCNALLIPGENVHVRLHKKPSPQIIWTCSSCFTVKRFGVRKDYKMWLERKEAVLESNVFSNNYQSSTGVKIVNERLPIEVNKSDEKCETSVEKTKSLPTGVN